MEGMLRPVTLVTPTADRNGEAARTTTMATSRPDRRKTAHRAGVETHRGEDRNRPENPGGERSPWKERATARWQRRRSQRTRQRSKASRSRVAEQDTGNGVPRGGATTRGQRPQRCGTAADGGTSSRGVKAQSGKWPIRPDLHRPPDLSGGTCFRAEEEWSTVVETLRTPSGTGMQ